MTGRRPGRAASLLIGLLSATTIGYGATPITLSGAIAGSVKDGGGVPQMGATVLLFNRFDKLVQKAFTNATGDFTFGALTPDIYSIRVTLASFVPAFRKNIAIQPGVRSILAINLASVFSSIELVSTGPNIGPLMSDEWKSVLRSSMATRPVMRAVDEMEGGSSESRHANNAIFSETTGLLKVSSGEATPFAAINNQPDLGTYFALATSLFGNTKLQFSGNFGYALNSALPAAGFRTSIRRGDFGGPEIKLTMQQLALPSHGIGFGLGQENAPVLRSTALTLVDHLQILDNLDIEYGTTLESVTFLDRLNFLSPFARLNYHFDNAGTASVAYSSGAAPIDLWTSSRGEASDSLEQDIAALSMFPRVSLRDGDTRVQRTQSAEVGYSIVRGSRTYGAAYYRESVSNGALTMTAPNGLYEEGDLLPELSSRSSVFNIGNFERSGYMAFVTQTFGDRVNATISYGRGGSLRSDSRELITDDPEELRSSMHSSQQQWLNGKIAFVLPVTATKLNASYQWMDYRSLTPNHVYLTQRLYAEPGLNLRIRQPIPSIPGMPGRLEASAELRNLLAQGYLGMMTSDGRKVLLTNAPRAVRGGVAFIF